MLNHLPPRLTFPYNKTFPQKAESKLSFPQSFNYGHFNPPPPPPPYWVGERKLCKQLCIVSLIVKLYVMIITNAKITIHKLCWVIYDFTQVIDYPEDEGLLLFLIKVDKKLVLSSKKYYTSEHTF